jgi:hypothetical protein
MAMATDERRFESTAWVAQLPIHLADRIAVLMSRISLNGEHATANETVAVIEATFGYLGRLWVAEYLHAGATNAAINCDLLDFSSRPVLTGLWVSLARRIRHLFAAQSLGTVAAGLEQFDFGAQDDATHAVTRLIAYRNSFSHGSLASVVEDIRTHRRLIEQVVAAIPALWEQPIHCVTEETGALRLAVRGWPLVTGCARCEEPRYEPFIVGADGETRLRLYPLLHVASTEEGLALRTGNGKGRQQAVATLFERETLRLWYGRYRLEQQGHLAFEGLLQARPHPQLSPAVFSMVREALSAPGVARVIVEAHPGCGKMDLIARLALVAPPARRVETAAYVAESGGLSQSGVTFARFILRRAEAALGLDAGAFSGAEDQLPKAIVQAEERLLAEGVLLLVGVENVHQGVVACQREILSIADVFALPSGRGIRLLGTLYPGRIGERLACDRRIVLPVQGSSPHCLDELEAALSELCPPDDLPGRKVLLTLMDAGRPLTLFELCDALELDGLAVFEPEIERTLWRLRPLLLVDGVNPERRWRTLDGFSRSWLSKSN